MSDSHTVSGEVRKRALALAKEHPLLKGMTPVDLNILSETAMLGRFKEGEMIFREATSANQFYLIVEGSVALESARDGEEPVRVQEIGAGEVLGWSWLFPPYLWHFDARATSDTEMILFYGPRLREQCEMNTGFGYRMVLRMAGVAIDRLQSARREWLAAARGE